MSKQNSLISKTIVFMFSIMPIIDAINGYLYRNYNKSGIGAAFHLLMLIVLFAVTYLKRKCKFGVYDRCAFCMAFCMLLSILVNEIIIGSYQSISLERIEKILCTCFFLSTLYRLIRDNIISKKQLELIVNYQCYLVVIITFLANITKTANATYQTSQTGRIGFYTGSNEPIVIFIIISAILYYKLINSFEIRSFILFLINEANFVFAQSKSSYGAAIFFLVLFVAYIYSNLNNKIRAKYLLVGFPIVTVGGYLVYNLFNKTVSSFITRQLWTQNTYMDSGMLNYLTTGRTTRFSMLYAPIFTRNLFSQLFELLFGQGANFGYGGTFEMDLFDVFLYGGLISAVLVIKIMIRSMKEVYNSTKSKIVIIMISFVLMFSFFTGHLWTGGTSGIYLGLMIVYFIFFMNNQSVEE